MPESSTGFHTHVSWLPAGLVSWYAPDGESLVVVTSWVALVGGTEPRLRTAWHCGYDPELHFWTGGDFVLNVPHESGLEEILGFMSKGRLCLKAEDDLTYSCLEGTVAAAPRLLDCAVQIECVGGALSKTDFAAELCGGVARIHRDGATLDPLEIPDLCSIYPLSP